MQDDISKNNIEVAAMIQFSVLISKRYIDSIWTVYQSTS